MQLLKISKDTKLSDVANIVGERNVESVLALNGLTRTPNIGKAFDQLTSGIKGAASSPVDRYSKIDSLNNVTNESDIFETMALQSSTDWKVTAALHTLPGMIRLPESVVIPDSSNTFGNHQPVPAMIYNQVIAAFKQSGEASSSAFAQYSTLNNLKHPSITTPHALADPFQWFQIPWGKVSLFSSMDKESKDFPVYPEELADSRQANFSTMPDMLYQYEPWQVYQSSGPRSNTYSFTFHRDMWTGNHKDGKANELIRFCEANCYPEFNGSAVKVPTVTLYIAGQPHITGVMTSANTHWSGPLGQDGWYLVCDLELSITEVSETPLNYQSIKIKGLG